MGTALDPRAEYVMRLGDNALVLAQRLSAWVAHAPIMEEDVALANVSLDLFGQARLWLSYAGELEGAGRDEDRLAFHRDAREFRNVLLVERPNGDFAATTVRGYFYDLWSYLGLGALEGSRSERVAAIAEKSRKETAYHLRRSEDWMIRLGDGTEESHTRTQRAVDELWRYTGELFLGDEVDAAMLEAGIGFDPPALLDPWFERVHTAFSSAMLEIPGDTWMQRGGKQGTHTEQLSYLLVEMQALPRAMPEAVW
ncbi:MAG TPA: 1,2-phenylacetyl-CoA epoxidase subunit PaaC [Candidatus Tyrphobacter sp.]